MTDIEKIKHWIEQEIKNLRKEMAGYRAGKEEKKDMYTRKCVLMDVKHQLDKQDSECAQSEPSVFLAHQDKK